MDPINIDSLGFNFIRESNVQVMLDVLILVRQILLSSIMLPSMSMEMSSVSNIHSCIMSTTEVAVISPLSSE